MGEGKNRSVVRLDSKGKPLAKEHQDRLNALGVPPAWVNVHLASSPKADLQAKGQVVVKIEGQPDKLKWQSIYSKEHNENQAHEKFARAVAFDKARPVLVAQAGKDMARGDATAAAVCLIAATGFRVGGQNQLGKEAAFGATTLEGRHVSVKGDKISFHFTGKHGVDIQHEITDKRLAKFIEAQKAKVGPDGKIFSTNDGKVRDYIKATTGNPHFKAHDFRTWHGTAAARMIIARDPKIREGKEFKKFQMTVAKEVSEHLHNTPAMALSSYIDPKVWSPVRKVA